MVKTLRQIRRMGRINFIWSPLPLKGRSRQTFFVLQPTSGQNVLLPAHLLRPSKHQCLKLLASLRQQARILEPKVAPSVPRLCRPRTSKEVARRLLNQHKRQVAKPTLLEAGFTRSSIKSGKGHLGRSTRHGILPQACLSLSNEFAWRPKRMASR